METATLQRAISQAKSKWDKANRPDSFQTTLTVREDGQQNKLRATINYRETFPLGAVTYRLTLTPTNPQPGQKDLQPHTERFSVVHGFIHPPIIPTARQYPEPQDT